MISMLAKSKLDHALVDLYGPLTLGKFWYVCLLVVLDNFNGFFKRLCYIKHYEDMCE